MRALCGHHRLAPWKNTFLKFFQYIYPAAILAQYAQQRLRKDELQLHTEESRRADFSRPS
jgi:hypothetical protein